jgi:hypothetical protein
MIQAQETARWESQVCRQVYLAQEYIRVNSLQKLVAITMIHDSIEQNYSRDISHFHAKAILDILQQRS